jgi:hypothetical protein
MSNALIASKMPISRRAVTVWRQYSKSIGGAPSAAAILRGVQRRRRRSLRPAHNAIYLTKRVTT